MADKAAIQLTLDAREFMFLVSATSYAGVTIIPGASDSLRAAATANVTEDIRALGNKGLADLTLRMVELGDSAFGG